MTKASIDFDEIKGAKKSADGPVNKDDKKLSKDEDLTKEIDEIYQGTFPFKKLFAGSAGTAQLTDGLAAFAKNQPRSTSIVP